MNGGMGTVTPTTDGFVQEEILALTCDGRQKLAPEHVDDAGAVMHEFLQQKQVGINFI